MSGMTEVHVGTEPLARFGELVEEERMKAAEKKAVELREFMGDGALWHVNSTAVGGGVAEMLRPLLAYARGAGIDARWGVIEGDPEFFELTKRLHHALHGEPGDGSAVDESRREHYEAVNKAAAVDLLGHVDRDDIVIIHDPQPLGMVPHLIEAGARIIFRCHIGPDAWNDETRAAWRFLSPYLEDVSACVFSRASYAPDIVPEERRVVIPPSIDAFSPKNAPIDPDTARAILVYTGLLGGLAPEGANRAFRRLDGTPARVERAADVVQLGAPPPADAPLIVQVSRWDPLKDPVGVMRGFETLADGRVHRDAHLVLAGPNVHGVADDPEAVTVYQATLAAHRALPHGVRQHVHLACLPTADVDENAIIVNALQRQATIVVQKSLHEGFGLTVTEAMWKAKPVVASRVGGLVDQIDDGVNGVLLDDPRDTETFGACLRTLLDDQALRERLGEAAKEKVRREFLGIRTLFQFADLLMYGPEGVK